MGKTWRGSLKKDDMCREHEERRKLREVKRHGDEVRREHARRK